MNASAPSIGDPVPQRGRIRRLIPVAGRLNAALESHFEKERDQLPLWLPVGLGSGIAAWFWLGGAHSWSAFLICGLAVALAALALGPAARWGRAIAIFSFAASLGCVLIWVRA